jgi:hypothetical protein
VNVIDPKNQFAYELQLLEPWGYYRSRETIHIDKLPHKYFGLRNIEGSLLHLESQSEVALENVNDNLELMVRAKEIQSSLLEVLSPQGLEYCEKKLLI